MKTMDRCDYGKGAAWLLLALSALVFPARLGAGSPTFDEVIARHCQARETTTALKAQFVQTKVFTLFDEKEVSEGTLYFAQPERIRWQYTEPDLSSTVINGRRGWSVFPDIKQVQTFELEGSITNKVLSILGFGRCGTPLTESFEITMSAGKKGAVVLAMTPTDKDITPYFSRVDLTLDGKDYLPRRIELHEKAGDILVFEFSHLDRKVELDEAMFDYVVPDGYEVVEY
jgi:outer membrane lipoprotein carrier protein